LAFRLVSALRNIRITPFAIPIYDRPKLEYAAVPRHQDGIFDQHGPLVDLCGYFFLLWFRFAGHL
jgi:hypothetical protein